MATERIIVEITAKGARVVKRDIDKIGKSAKKSQAGVSGLTKVLGLLGGALLLKKVVEFADGFTRIQNKMRIAGFEADELTQSIDRLFVISNKTRSSLEANAALFQRVSLAQKELGATTDQLFDFTEAVGRGLQIQGTSAEQAKGAILQLSQAMGSGIVRAEEFNSILEGAFPIALAAAAGIDKAGGSVAKLRQLIIKGEISSEELFFGILSQKENLEELAEKTMPTVGQAFQKLENSLTVTIGRLNQATGFTAAISQAIFLLSDNLDILVKVAGAAGITLLAAFSTKLPAAIGKATAATAKFIFAFGPIGIAVGLFAALLVATDSLTGGLFEAEGVTVGLGEVITATFTVAKQLFDEAAAVIVGVLGPAFGSVGIEVNSLRDILAVTFGFMVDFVDAQIKGIKFLAKAFPIAFSNFPATLELIFKRAFNGALIVAAKGVNLFSALVNKILPDALQIGEVTFNSFKLTGSEAAIDVQAQFRKLNEEIKNEEGVLAGVVARVKEQAIAVAKVRQEKELLGSVKPTDKETIDDAAKLLELTTKQASSFQSLRDSLQPLVALTRDYNDDLKLLATARLANVIKSDEELTILQGLLTTEFEKAAKALELDLNPELARQAKILEEIQGPAQEFAKDIKALNVLFAQGDINAEEFRKKLADLQGQFLETRTDLASGFKKGIAGIAEEFNDFATLSEGIVRDAFTGMEDALVKFVQTGKFEIKDLVASIAADFLKLSIRQTITGPLSNLLNNTVNADSGGGLLGGILGPSGGGAQAATITVDASMASMDIANAMSTSGANVASGIGDSLTQAGSGLLSGLGGIFDGVLSGLGSLFSSIGGGLSSLFGSIGGIGGLFGFKDGGNFNVGGSGGPDSQVVAFRATPGEPVAVGENAGGTTIFKETKISVSLNGVKDFDSFNRSKGRLNAALAQAVERANNRDN